jgi:preprotein translocase subunit SecG
MTIVIIVVHLMLVLAMIGVVLLQRSEGGALGIGGGGGAGGFMTRRGAGNLLTRATAFLAAAFFATSIALTVIARLESRPADILERLQDQQAESAAPTAPADDGTTPAVPAPPSGGVLDALRQESGQSGGPQLPPAGQ